MKARNSAETTAAKQRGKPFKRGETGNPNGRPIGARNKATLAAEALLDGESEALTRKAIDMAMSGDGSALRLCMDRLVAPRKDRPISFALPPLETTGDIVKAASAVVAGVAAGDLTPSEAMDLGKLIDSFANAMKADDLHKRMEAIEAALGVARA
jgi:hypothetical protein